MPDDLLALQQFADIVAEKIVDHKRTEELRRIVADHQVWLQTGGEAGADLRESNLAGSRLAGARMPGANLKGTNRDGAKLPRAVELPERGRTLPGLER